MGDIGCLLLVGILALSTIVVVQSDTCTYNEPCTTRQRYYTSCGFWGWSRCTRYRTVSTTCSKEVECSEERSPGDCNKSCGGGTRDVTRKCVAANKCEKGLPTVSEACNINPCPVKGGVSSWKDWSCGDCSVECGGGSRMCTRTRDCDNPEPAHGGATCRQQSIPLEQSKTETCGTNPCPVHGGASSWKDWTCGDCSVTCDGGSKACSRSRECNNPTPAHGGATCAEQSIDLEESKTEICGTNPCPIDGGASSWTNWTCGDCSVTCDGGSKACSRSRECNNPTPAHGGATCAEQSIDLEESKTEICGTDPCPIDGGASSWTDWSCRDCSVTCDGGSRACNRSRECKNPAPAHGGATCLEQSIHLKETKTDICGTDPCPIDGGWTDWSDWGCGDCTVDCCGGTKNCTRTRSCTNPPPQHGGAECPDESQQDDVWPCNEHVCPVSCARVGDFHEHPCPPTCPTDMYYVCETDSSTAIQRTCAAGTKWSHSLQTCDFEDNVQCEGVEDPNACDPDTDSYDRDETDCHFYYQCDNGQWVRHRCPGDLAWNGHYCDFSVTVEECGPVQEPEPCTEGTYQPHETDCTKYELCHHGDWTELSCPPGLYWSQTLNTCTWPSMANCQTP